MKLPDQNSNVPEFSIITVTLNSESSIQRCINSVRNQTLKNFEYIVVDGKSTDQTLQIIGENRDIIRKLISEPDMGLYHAMNKGIKLAEGRLIGILNSDDEYFPDTLQQVSLAVAVGVDSGLYFGNVINAMQSDLILEVPVNEIVSRMIPHPATFITRKTYERWGDFNTKFHVAADYELILRLRKAGVYFYKIDKPLTITYPGGFSAKHRFRSILETIFLHFKFREKSIIVTILRELRYFLAATLIKR